VSLVGDLRRVGGEWRVERRGFAGQSYRGTYRGREYCVDRAADDDLHFDSFGRFARWRCLEFLTSDAEEPFLMPDWSSSYFGHTPAAAFAGKLAADRGRAERLLAEVNALGEVAEL
jgi:hypothetical protein